jgi:hypothetical protein
MKFLRTIVPLIAAFHLVIATSGVPLAYMFCGDTLCSWEFATTIASEQKNEMSESCESTSCCEDMTESECHTELHIAQLSLDALQAASHQTPQPTMPLVAIVPVLTNGLNIAQNLAFYAIFLDKPPPHSFDRSIRYRSLLI